MDGRSAAPPSDASLAWPLEAGRHVASARDSQGRQADVAFVVR